MIKNGRTYDILKAIAQIWLPALGTLYFTLALIYGLPYADEITKTVVAVDTFLGIILGISTASYNRINSPKYVGTLVRNPEEAESEYTMTFDKSRLQDPNVLTKKEAVFRIIDESH